MSGLNGATFLKPFVLNPFSHVADWVAPFPRSRHSPPPPLHARDLVAIIIMTPPDDDDCGNRGLGVALSRKIE